MAVIFTKEILGDPRKFLEHLNLLVREMGGSAQGGVVATTDGNIVGGAERFVPGAGIQFTRELGALKVTATGISAVGGGGGSLGIALGYAKAVTGAGTATFDIADVGTSSYIIDGFNLTSGGDKGLIVPHIPPLTDSRTAIQFKVDHYETGTIFVWLIPINDVIGFSQAVTPGVLPLTFAARSSVNYLIDGFVLLSDGSKSIIVPHIPPLTDSRTLTGVNIEISETGTLYAWIVPY